MKPVRKVLCVFGTRPEAIKMAPVVRALRESASLDPVVCVTGQHRGLLDQVMELFGMEADHDLNLMAPGQDLTTLTARCLVALKNVLQKARPDLVLVHGDTTTTFSAALAAYYERMAIGHVEAGLRTGDKYAPFPEEMNRSMIAPLVDLHFAPTQGAIDHLEEAGVSPDKIFMTGNTAIDALLWVTRQSRVPMELDRRLAGRTPILVTAHRRENFGEPLERIFGALRRFADAHPEHVLVIPVHPNPQVRPIAQRLLGENPQVILTEPLDYSDLSWVLRTSRFVVTDSGGLQEEAPSLGKPVLVLRETTERPEAVESGCAQLVGSDENRILARMTELAAPGSSLHRSMSRAVSPFGDGRAAERMVSIIERCFLDDDKLVFRATDDAPETTNFFPSPRPGVGLWPLPGAHAAGLA